MAVFLVTYDLVKPETHEDYEQLWRRLREWNARKVLYSEWLISWNTTPAALRDDLLPLMDENDRLLVIRVTQAAWKRLMVPDADAKALIENG